LFFEAAEPAAEAAGRDGLFAKADAACTGASHFALLHFPQYSVKL
jgi:hypothetical protein